MLINERKLRSIVRSIIRESFRGVSGPKSNYQELPYSAEDDYEDFEDFYQEDPELDDEDFDKDTLKYVPDAPRDFEDSLKLSYPDYRRSRR